MSNSDAVSRLRAHFAQHNRNVLFLALLNFAVVCASWALLYFVLYWLTLLAISVERPNEAQAPVHFPQIFAACAIALCFFAWLLRRLQPNEMPRDKKSLGEILLDFVLMVPRMTLAIFGTLRAMFFFREPELLLAQRLLERIDREETLPLHAVPIEITDENTRLKILLALQITGLIDMRKSDEDFVLALRGEKARLLCQQHVRLRAR